MSEHISLPVTGAAPQVAVLNLTDGNIINTAASSAKSIVSGRGPHRGASQKQKAPMRRLRIAAPKKQPMSAEALRASEERDRQMIEKCIAEGRVTLCPPRWALGAIVQSAFGVEG